MAVQVASTRARCHLRLAVLGEFRVIDHHEELHISGGSQRLLAFLALHTSWVKRALVAGTLWPDTSDGRAHASLRSALSRMETPIRNAVDVTPVQVRLADSVAVDLVNSRTLAQRLIIPRAVLDESDLGAAAIRALSLDLLPDWYDDWVLLEVEEWRQLRLHALEALAEQLVARRRFVDAAGAALAAVRADPLRESPHATLIRVHLAEGNRSEALREFTRYKELLSAELAITPSPAFRGLVSGIERCAKS